MDTKLAELEAARKKVVSSSLWCIMAGVIAFVVALALAIPGAMNQSDVLLIVGGLLLIAAVVLIVVGAVRINSFKKSTQLVIFSQVLTSIYPNARYQPKNGISIDVFMRPGFFAMPDLYQMRNLISATYKEVPFTMNDYCLQKRCVDSNGRVYYTTYAEGRIFRFDFKRVFNQTLKVVEKSTFFNFSIDRSLTKVETESTAFNKTFMTLCSDPLTAFYILTPQMQEQIIALERKFSGKIYFAFMSSELFIAVNDGKHTDKFSVLKPFTEESLVYVSSQFRIPINFVEALKLAEDKFASERKYEAGS